MTFMNIPRSPTGAQGPKHKHTLTLNGLEVKYMPGETLLQLAKRHHLSIPTLCYDPRLTVPGHCKVCLVEVDGKIKASCMTKAEDGMVVETHSAKSLNARKKRVLGILKTHKGDCKSCAQYNTCGLLALAEEVGLEKPVFTNTEVGRETVIENKIKIDLDKCVSCGKCVRVCAEIRRVGALKHPSLCPDVDNITFLRNCEMCGQCAAICPTGAIVEIYKGVFEKRIRSVCTYCATGCSIYLEVKDEKIAFVTTDDLDPVGKGNLCVKGRFGFTFVNSENRLKKPLIRNKDGVLEEASWQEALSLVYTKLTDIKNQYGSHAIGGIGSARATNEDNYMFQRLMRAGLGTNNLDNCARLCHTPAAYALQNALGISASTSSLKDLAYTEVILVVGSNTTEAHPIAGLHVKWAHARGARLIVVDPREIPLVNEAEMHLQIMPSTNIALINGFLKVIVDEELYDKDFIEKNTEGWDKLNSIIKNVYLEEVSDITNVPVEQIVKAARYYASSKRSMIISGLGVDEHEYGTEGMFALINLALSTGNIGKPGTGVFCLRGQNNVQGSSDMGCLPHLLPGTQSVTDRAVRDKFAAKWGKPVPEWVGLKSTQMMDAAIAGDIKALYIWGEDPAQTHGNTTNIRNALSSLEFLVYQDMFMSETAKFAHVILPVASFVEKSGTYTNTERRVRLLNQALSPLNGVKADWQIFSELSEKFAVPSPFNSPADIYDEMALLTYYFKGISHKRLGSAGIQWPCPDAKHPGTERLYVDGFPKGKAKFYPVYYREQTEKLSEDYPFMLVTGRRLYHFNNSAQTKHTETTLEKENFLDINPQDAKKLALTDGQTVRLISKFGQLDIKLREHEGIMEGTLFTSFHYTESLVNVLTGGARDTYTDTYNYKAIPVRIEKNNDNS